jgi:hypothetical protein
MDLSGEMVWFKGHPKIFSEYGCINFKVLPNETSSKIELTSRNCSHNFIFACEVI